MKEDLLRSCEIELVLWRVAAVPLASITEKADTSPVRFVHSGLSFSIATICQRSP